MTSRLLLSTDPRPEGFPGPRMDFGGEPRRPELEGNADRVLRFHLSLLAAVKAAKEAPADKEAPAATEVVDSANAVKVVLGRKRRRLFLGFVFSVDSAGVVHVCRFTPKQRFLPPALVRTWRGVA